MSWLPAEPAVELATFTTLGPGAGAGRPFTLQFNPESLEYTISNELDDRNSNNGARQVVKKSTAKLSMTLLFDTTDTGADVREITANVEALLAPSRDSSRKQVPPKVAFKWGTISFQGVVEQYKETIDFFSPGGVPLRSSINLTLADQSFKFRGRNDREARADRTELPVVESGAASPDAAARQLNDPRAARAIADLNGSASLRFGAGFGATLSVGASVQIGGPAGLSAGLSAGIGAGVGVSAGLSVGASASGSAFAGLRTPPAASASIDLDQARAALLPPPRAGAALSFGPGGRITAGSSGLSADVGAEASLSSGQARLRFGP